MKRKTKINFGCFGPLQILFRELYASIFKELTQYESLKAQQTTDQTQYRKFEAVVELWDGKAQILQLQCCHEIVGK